MTLLDMLASVMVLTLLTIGVVYVWVFAMCGYFILTNWLRKRRPPTQRQLLRRAARVANARHETETLEQMWLAPTTDEPQ